MLIVWNPQKTKKILEIRKTQCASRKRVILGGILPMLHRFTYNFFIFLTRSIFRTYLEGNDLWPMIKVNLGGVTFYHFKIPLMPELMFFHSFSENPCSDFWVVFKNSPPLQIILIHIPQALRVSYRSPRTQDCALKIAPKT